MNEPDLKIPAPISSGDMNVHLSYIRRDLDELKSLQKSQHAENISALVDLKNSYPTRIEFNEMRKDVEISLGDHEKRIRDIETMIPKAFEKINVRLAYYSGGIAAVLGITEFVLNYFHK